MKCSDQEYSGHQAESITCGYTDTHGEDIFVTCKNSNMDNVILYLKKYK